MYGIVLSCLVLYGLMGSIYIKLYYILLPHPPLQQRRGNGSNYIKLYYILLPPAPTATKEREW